MALQDFLDTLAPVSPEFHRNFRLITDLDERSGVLVAEIDDCYQKYKDSNSKSERLKIKQKTEELFEKLLSFADDKVELALQVYLLIDKHITNLTRIGQAEGLSSAPIGFDMPLDPNEPEYCFCRTVSHGEMIGCDNDHCQVEWFHLACVGLLEAPKGKWYCQQCSNEIKSRKRKPKSKSKRARRY